MLVQYQRAAVHRALATMFLARGLASMLSTEPQRLSDDSPIKLISTDIKLIDGPKVNDLIVHRAS